MITIFQAVTYNMLVTVVLSKHPPLVNVTGIYARMSHFTRNWF